MLALVFAAGLGTRLRPLTNDRPKAMVEVGGKPLLGHLMERLHEVGCRKVVVNVHHFADQIIDYLKANHGFGMAVAVSDERDELLDTGGGIRKAWSLFAADEPILVHNVDIVSGIDLRALYDQHCREAQRMASSACRLGATLAVAERKTSRYLLFDGDMRMCGWRNVTTGELRGHDGPKMRAFAGVHVVDPRLMPLLQKEPRRVFGITDFYIGAAQELALQGYDCTGTPWVDCGKPESLPLAAEILAGRES